ncbi:fungal-specific transcription factor domain-containing protein, partial [Aspergillus floccosus]
MVCMTLSHRMNRIRNDSVFNPLAVTFFRYRGLVIRSLSSDIDEGHKRTGDVVLAGIITLLLVDVQQGASPHWRCHLEGLQKLITLRGGIRALAGIPSLAPLLHCFVSLAVIGDTSSPASDLAMTTLQLETDFILERFGSGIFAFQMCPTHLFAEIIRINHLRARASKQDPAELNDLIHEAYNILRRIHDFSSEQWTQSKPSSKVDWMLLGNVYQAAVALYCILSLQSLSILPRTPLFRASCTSHGQYLQQQLNKALPSPRIKRFTLWPLVVLGVEAVNGGAGMRAFVREQLPEMSRHVGSYVPLTAKDVLERFWASGETRWDACFDRSYMLVTQIAVDLSGL